MIRKQSGEIAWLEFELLADISHLRHGVFLRHGGVSTAPFSSLNVGGTRKLDDPGKVHENRERIRKVLGVDELATCTQVHRDCLAVVPGASEEELDRADGLMTDCSHLALLIQHADCQAAIFYDTKTGVIANVHAGWRGNVLNIYRSTVERMGRVFGSKPEDLLVCVSPSLGPEKAEFIHYHTEWPESFWPFQISPTYFDLWEIGRQQLLEAGILDHHIQFAKICTYSNPDDFFSYRRDKITGGHATLIAKTV